jgi:hypothetical protein
MLFDLRGRGRRRTVQILYLGLAVLMGGGLVFLGVGGGLGSTGILSSLSGSEGSNGVTFSNEIKKYKKLTEQQPSNAQAWEKLTNAQLHEAANEVYVSRSGGVTSKGKELYAQVAKSWDGYLALNPPQPNAELAQRMVSVFDEEGLNQPANAVRVLQIAVAARPTSTALWASLAVYAYKAKDVHVGDLAAEHAISIAPASERAGLKTELAKLKANPSGGETSTLTTEGKTLTGKTGPNGTFQGTVVSPSTPAPATGATGKKK